MLSLAQHPEHRSVETVGQRPPAPRTPSLGPRHQSHLSCPPLACRRPGHAFFLGIALGRCALHHSGRGLTLAALHSRHLNWRGLHYTLRMLLSSSCHNVLADSGQFQEVDQSGLCLSFTNSLGQLLFHPLTLPPASVAAWSAASWPAACRAAAVHPAAVRPAAPAAAPAQETASLCQPGASCPPRPRG